MDTTPPPLRVVIDLWATPDGRIDGSVDDGGDVRTFEGILALLAVIEALLDARRAAPETA